VGFLYFTAFSAEDEVQSWIMKLLWCGYLARYICTS